MDIQKAIAKAAKAQEELDRAVEATRDAILTPLSKLTDKGFLALDPEALYDVVALLSAQYPPLIAMVAAPEARAIIDRFRDENRRRTKTARRSDGASRKRSESARGAGTASTGAEGGEHEQGSARTDG